MSCSNLEIIIVIVHNLVNTAQNEGLTTEAVVTVEVEEWGQQLQAFHIPSTSQETHSNIASSPGHSQILSRSCGENWEKAWDQNYVMDRKWWTRFVLTGSTISGP